MTLVTARVSSGDKSRECPADAASERTEHRVLASAQTGAEYTAAHHSFIPVRVNLFDIYISLFDVDSQRLK